jgi:8-oxo-dGTP diphosphatase
VIGQQQLLDEAHRDGIMKLVVGSVIHHEGRVLILRRSSTDEFLPGIEELPSGGVDPGEDLLAALTRELAEEVGLPGPATPDPTFVTSFDYFSGFGRKARQYTFSLGYAGFTIRLSEEHTSFRWIEMADLAESDLTVETQQAIRDWAETRRSAASTEHPKPQPRRISVDQIPSCEPSDLY